MDTEIKVLSETKSMYRYIDIDIAREGRRDREKHYLAFKIKKKKKGNPVICNNE